MMKKVKKKVKKSIKKVKKVAKKVPTRRRHLRLECLPIFPKSVSSTSGFNS